MCDMCKCWHFVISYSNVMMVIVGFTVLIMYAFDSIELFFPLKVFGNIVLEWRVETTKKKLTVWCNIYYPYRYKKNLASHF